MVVILISGKMGSGKTTQTKKFIDRLGASYIKFADPLYECHDAIWDVLEKYGVTREKKSGDLLQYLGTEFGRKRDENLWVNIARKRADDFLAEGRKLLVLDDCRFENEFNAFPEALKVRIECSRDVRKERADSWRENENHPSEIGLDNYAAQGKFDLYYDSEKMTSDEIFQDIILKLKG